MLLPASTTNSSYIITVYTMKWTKRSAVMFGMVKWCDVHVCIQACYSRFRLVSPDLIESGQSRKTQDQDLVNFVLADIDMFNSERTE